MMQFHFSYHSFSSVELCYSIDWVLKISLLLNGTDTAGTSSSSITVP